MIKKKFVKAALVKNIETFVSYVVVLLVMLIYSNRPCQIRLLLANQIIIKVFAKSFDYTDIFLSDFIIKLSKYTRINNYIIKLEKYK